MNTETTSTDAEDRETPSVAADVIPLRIETAAIRDINGKVWTLPRPRRHHDIIRSMREAGYDGPVNGVDQQGFVLSDGRYCRRKVAWHVAEDAGQLKNGKMIGPQLTTEDLW